MARLSMRCPDEMVAAVDAARGDVPREVWLRRAVERALGEPTLERSPSPTFSARYEQPVRLGKGAFNPRPKGGQ